MKYLPIENITYKSSLKEEEIIKRLEDNIELESTFWSFGSSKRLTKPYKGQMNGREFKMKRNISYRNSFQPIITGVIESDFDGMTIKVKMKLHVFVRIFLFFWFIIVGLGCLAFLLKFINDTEFNPMLILPFGMLIFAYALTMFAFKFESNKSKNDLQFIFKANVK